MRRFGVWGIVVLTSAAVVPLAGRAHADGGGGTGSADATSDARIDGAKDSAIDVQTESGSDGSAGRGDSGRDARGAETGAGETDANRSLVGTSATACGPVAGTLNPETLPSCTNVCPLGSCVPASEVAAQASSLPNCPNSTDKCMPRFLIETLGNVRFKSCQSVGGGEGRCIPSCLPAVSTQLLPIPRDVCLESERCIPCFNPVDGTDNGICHYGCDTGPQREPTTFPGCCGTEGFCLEASLLGAQDQARLRQESCGAKQLCAPKNPNTTNFACEVRGSEQAPPNGSGGRGNSDGGSGGSKSASDAGKNPAAQAVDDGGCGCRMAKNDAGRAGSWLSLFALAALARRRRVIR